MAINHSVIQHQTQELIETVKSAQDLGQTQSAVTEVCERLSGIITMLSRAINEQDRRISELQAAVMKINDKLYGR